MGLWSLELIIGNGSQYVFTEVIDLSYLQYYVITWVALVCIVWIKYVYSVFLHDYKTWLEFIWKQQGFFLPAVS